MIAAKHFDIVMGVDVHIIMIPTPGGPVPTPIPHPFVGMMFDPNDYDMKAMAMSAASSMGLDLTPVLEIKAVIDGINKEMDKFNPAKRINQLIEDAKSFVKEQLGINPPPSGPAHVNVNGLPRSIITSKGIAAPPHIPIGGPFQKPPDNECEAFLGSLTVRADQEHMCFLGCMTQSCQDIPPFPNSVIMAIPGGPLVLVGGPPVPSLNQLMLKAFNRAMSAIRESNFVKGISQRIHNAAGRAMDRLGIPADSFVRDMAHDQICEVTGHPVVIATGKVYTERTDFSLPGPVPLKWTRKWKSTSVYEGPMGRGWHCIYDLSIAVEEDAIVVRMADGRPVIFPPLFQGDSYTNPHEKLSLKREGNAYIMKDDRQLEYHFGLEAEGSKEIIFDDTGEEGVLPLKRIQNSSGHGIQFQHDKQNRLTKIIDSGNRELPVTTDRKGRILKIEGPHPDIEGQWINLTSYEYDAFGNCITVRDALNQPFSYEYENHLLVKETNRNGLSFYFQYDQMDSSGRCIRTWGDGGIYNHALEYNLEEQWTKVTNSLGHTSQYFWDDRGLVWKKVDAKGNASYQTFNEQSKLIREVDAMGYVTSHTYDSLGNKTETIFPDKTSIQMVYEGSLLTGAIDQNGGAWSWTYDGKGRLISRVDCEGNNTAYNYKSGRLASLVNPLGGIWQFQFNEKNELSEFVLPDGSTYIRSFNQLGRLIQTIDPKGNKRNRFFDNLGRVVKVKNPDGNIRQFVYDGEGNVLIGKDLNRIVKFEYTQMNLLKAREEAGIRLEFTYDTEGNLLGIQNELGHIYRFELDENMQVKAEYGFDGLTKLYKRNQVGWLKEVESSSGLYTVYAYDTMGRILEVLYSDGSIESYTYREDGKLLKAINNYVEVEIERDGLGNILREFQGSFEVESVYNAASQRIAYKSSQGTEVTIQRNQIGKVKGIEVKSEEASWEAKFEHDELGLEIERILPGDVRSIWVRDQVGRPSQHKIETAEDNLEKERLYTWTSPNRILTIHDSKWGNSKFKHDTFGNLVSANYGDGKKEWRVSDAVGNLFKNERRDGRKYGPGGQLWESEDFQYRYDLEGNLIEKIGIDGKTIWVYEWNANGLLRSVKRPDGEKVSFVYDAMGRRVAKRFKDTLTRWAWDGNKILHEWIELVKPNQSSDSVFSEIFMNPFIHVSELNTENSEEKENGLEAGIIFLESGAETLSPVLTLKEKNDYSLNMGISTWIFEPGRFSPLVKLSDTGQHGVITDHLGTPVAMYNQLGEITWEGEISVFGQLRERENSVNKESCPFRFPGQYEDKETGLSYNRFRYYEPQGGFYLSRDPIGLLGGFKLYSYVKDPLYLFDPLGLINEDCGPDETIGQQIANNDHTFDKHAEELGAEDREDMADIIDGVVLNADRTVSLDRGRTVYRQDDSGGEPGITVIHNESDPEGGTAMAQSDSEFERTIENG